MSLGSNRPRVIITDADNNLFGETYPMPISVRGDDGSIIDWGGSDTGNPLGVNIYGPRSGGGFNQAPVELNPTTGEKGLNVNVMPYGDPIVIEGEVEVTNSVFFPDANPSFGSETISTTAALIMFGDGSRSYFDIVNAGTGFLYLGMDATVTTSGATMGLPVRPGGTFSQHGPACYRGNIYGIYSEAAASQNVAWWKGSNAA